MYFKAMEPKRILDFMEEKNKQLNQQKEIIKKMLPELEFRQKSGKLKTEATLYEGFKAIKNFYFNILDELSSGDVYYVIGASYGEDKPGVKEFFENYHKQRVQKNIQVKMLANHDVKETLVKSSYLNAEIRFLPQYIISNMIIVFYGNKVFIFFLSEEPVGFLMENEEVTKCFQSYFNAFWKIAKK
jgi:sugar-specific transcriptional regulator TrmB